MAGITETIQEQHSSPEAVEIARLESQIAELTTMLKTARENGELLEAIRDHSWSLVCFDVETRPDDWELGWRVIDRYLDWPKETVLSEVHADSPMEAVRLAIRARNIEIKRRIAMSDAEPSTRLNRLLNDIWNKLTRRKND